MKAINFINRNAAHLENPTADAAIRNLERANAMIEAGDIYNYMNAAGKAMKVLVLQHYDDAACSTVCELFNVPSRFNSVTILDAAGKEYYTDAGKPSYAFDSMLRSKEGECANKSRAFTTIFAVLGANSDMFESYSAEESYEEFEDCSEELEELKVELLKAQLERDMYKKQFDSLLERMLKR